MSKNKSFYKYLLGVTASLGLLYSCQKTVHGYISDRIYYQVNPFSVQQGITTVSSSLVLNGSTAPLNVEISSLTDASGNNADSILLKPQNINTFTRSITVNDSTLSDLSDIVKDSLVQPFNISPIGGRMQFTAATSYVPLGTYNLSLHVSNINGSRDLPNACSIVIKPLDQVYSLNYTSYRTNDPTGKTQIDRFDNNTNYLSTEILYSSSETENKIIVKFVDKNGVPFNAKAGEVEDWSNDPKSTTFFPKFHYWAPYYPLEYTDTALVQPLPLLNLAFPYYDLNGSNGASSGARFDSRISGLKSGLVLHTAVQAKLLTRGIYTIVVHLNNDEHN